jgi:hypothetical protein
VILTLGALNFLSFRTLEERIPENHPLRKLRVLVDGIVTAGLYLYLYLLGLTTKDIWRGLVQSQQPVYHYH